MRGINSSTATIATRAPSLVSDSEAPSDMMYTVNGDDFESVIVIRSSPWESHICRRFWDTKALDLISIGTDSTGEKKVFSFGMFIFDFIGYTCTIKRHDNHCS